MSHYCVKKKKKNRPPTLPLVKQKVSPASKLLPLVEALLPWAGRDDEKTRKQSNVLEGLAFNVSISIQRTIALCLF